MSEQGREISTVHTNPSDVRPGDWCAVKLVAVAGHDDDWACYVGPTNWSDRQVMDGGDKLTVDQAGVFAYLMQCRRYRG